MDGDLPNPSARLVCVHMLVGYHSCCSVLPCVPCRLALKGRQVKPRERERLAEVTLCLCKDLWVKKSAFVCVTPPTEALSAWPR